MFNVEHIHPMLVHFPIALTLLGCLLEGLGIIKKCTSRCGEIILYFATLSAIFAASTGSLFTPNFTVEKLIEAKNIHSTFAGVTVTFLCISTVLYLGRYFIKKYSSTLHYTGYIFYVLSAIAVGITGYLGGSLVYNDLLKM